MAHIAEVTEANGSINESEREQLLLLNRLMTQASHRSQLGDMLGAAKSGLEKGYDTTANFASTRVRQIGQAIKTSSVKVAPLADQAANTAAAGLSKAADVAARLGQKLPESSSKLGNLFQRKQAPTKDE